jgi:hypothetical protein
MNESFLRDLLMSLWDALAFLLAFVFGVLVLASPFIVGLYLWFWL